MNSTLYYCFDAYCGWCYGFSPVMKRIALDYASILPMEVLSGGMILPEAPIHIGVTADYIQQAYPTVEATTGIKFGEEYLWHINNPDKSDWYPNSEMPAIALCIFKEQFPENQVEFAAELQYALHFEGRDLTDKEAYRHLLEKWGIDPEDFFEKLGSEANLEQAQYEFQLCKQLQVTGFPCVLLHMGDNKFHLLARGFTPYEDLKARLDMVLSTINK